MKIITLLSIFSLLAVINAQMLIKDPPTPKIREIFSAAQKQLIGLGEGAPLYDNCTITSNFTAQKLEECDQLAPKIAKCLVIKSFKKIIEGKGYSAATTNLDLESQELAAQSEVAACKIKMAHSLEEPTKPVTPNNKTKPTIPKKNSTMKPTNSSTSRLTKPASPKPTSKKSTSFLKTILNKKSITEKELLEFFSYI